MTPSRFVSTALVALALTASLPAVGHAAAVSDFYVSSLTDGTKADLGPTACATQGDPCTLRAALEKATETTNFVIIHFDVTGTITLGSALPQIASTNLEIKGLGAAAVTIDANGGNFRILDVTAGSTTVTGVTLRGAQLAAGDGAGVLIAAGATFTGRDLVIESNAITGAGANDDGAGLASFGNLTLERVTVRDNSVATGGGGGLFLGGASSLVTDSTISGNAASGAAGGKGGGIYVCANTTCGGVTGSHAVWNSTISGNSSGKNAGGVLVQSAGGRIATVQLGYVTISGNSAASDTGGLRIGGATPPVVSVLGTVLTDNSDGGGAPDCGGGVAVQSQGGNVIGAFVIGDLTCGGFNAPSDLSGSTTTPLDGQLAALADNGGSTATRLPAWNSPAANAAAGLACPVADQRGTARPVAGACDAGAVERPAAANVAAELSAAAALEASTTGNITATLLNHGFAASGNATLVVTLPAVLDFAGATTSAGACAWAAPVLTCDFADVAADSGENVVIAVTAATEGSGNVTAVVSLAAAGLDPVTGDDQTALAITVTAASSGSSSGGSSSGSGGSSGGSSGSDDDIIGGEDDDAADDRNRAPAAPQLVAPGKGETGLNPASVLVSWTRSSDPDGDGLHYDVVVCQDPSFAGCGAVVTTADAGASWLWLPALAMGSLGLVRRRRGLLALALVLSLAPLGCGGVGGPDAASGPVLTQALPQLQPDTQYYWKVIARDDRGAEAHSSIWSFQTGR
jgi:MYXO-CTERM domain-containing protein